MEHGNPEGGAASLQQFTCSRGNRGCCAHGNVVRVADEAGDYAGEELFAGVQTNSSRYF
jgi:hypothetical protein